ncbi:MAG: cytochrome c biogenesis protein CcsA, partial [Actinomycetota bacterium]
MDAAAIGRFAVWGAVGLGIAVFAVAWIRTSHAKAWASRGLAAAAALTLIAVCALGWALVSGDFSLTYVAETTSRATPWPYRLSAIWGGMAGSLLFWSALLSVSGAVGVRSARRVVPHLVPATAATVAVTVVAFLVLGELVVSPFSKLAIPAIDGGGLVPILQHPAMVYHPPILYIGLTTLIAPFSLTVAAVITGRTDAAWLALVRRWLLVSWTALALGMVLGANWAYVELGWGGFWAWDSVENTALMPWLAATAFLHSAQIQS